MIKYTSPSVMEIVVCAYEITMFKDHKWKRAQALRKRMMTNVCITSEAYKVLNIWYKQERSF